MCYSTDLAGAAQKPSIRAESLAASCRPC